MESTYKELIELLERDIKKIVKKGDISKEDLCSIKEATSSVKNVETIMAMRSGDQYGSLYQEGAMRMHYGVPMSDPEYSGYNSNRSPVTGRYISNGVSPRMHYSEAMPHYQGHSIKDRMIACLEPMMDEAKGEYERQVVMNTINRIRTEN